jgi:hypothetical protein
MKTMIQLCLIAVLLAAVALPQTATVTTNLAQGSHVCFVRVPADMQARIQCMAIPAGGLAALRDKAQAEKMADNVTLLWRGPAHIVFDSVARTLASTIVSYPPNAVKNARTAQASADATLRTEVQSATTAATPAVPGTEP